MSRLESSLVGSVVLGEAVFLLLNWQAVLDAEAALAEIVERCRDQSIPAMQRR
jgi:hypothetical protein